MNIPVSDGVQGQVVEVDATQNLVWTASRANSYLTLVRALGSAIQAETVRCSYRQINTSIALVDGTMDFHAILVREPISVQGVKWWQVTKGSYTGDLENSVQLYSANPAAGTITQIATTGNVAAIWQTAASASMGSQLFTTTVSLAPGVYYVGALYNQSAQTTAPAIGGMNALIVAAFSSYDCINSMKLNGNYVPIDGLSPTGAFSMTAVNNSTVSHWFGLY